MFRNKIVFDFVSYFIMDIILMSNLKIFTYIHSKINNFKKKY